MNSLTIFLIAAVVPMLVTARSATSGGYMEWFDENNKEFVYADKWECKNVENCQSLYGKEKKWTCSHFGMCEEEEEDDDDSIEHALCNQASCERSCEEGYRCTCIKKRHCVQIDDLVYSPHRENSHHLPQYSTTEESQKSYEDSVKNEYNSYFTNGGSGSSDVDVVPLP